MTPSRAKPDRWNIIQDIFQNALERPLSERSEYVKQACDGDEELRSEVESLLANDSDAGAVLHSLIAADIKALDQTSSDMGLQLGPYLLVREIDSGGMGVVYLAVRSDDQYFQIVAIKMLRRGLVSPELVQRFRAERQVLATLNHPNIGAILDGGETEDGRPFIVMEYVEGQPITVACDGAGSSIRQRIELFRSVCSAVHYSHQKLVIHRDIKPSNVLVTPRGIVKLIDFGVSKPLLPELIAGQLPENEAVQGLMTPDYASPEQFLGRELTTVSDIYSLGVLLFELLTGSRPYTIHDLSPAAAEKIVCQQERRKPSSVRELSARTRRELTGDLDRIVLMAMDPDPSRRYHSAQHFDDDLLRFLQSKPVAARKSTPAYRLRKFVQRHTLAVLMTCTTVAALVASILLYSWQSRVADTRVKQVQLLANSTISDIAEKVHSSSASVETQALLFHSALNFLEQLRRNSGNDPRLLLELSRAYERVGDLQGSPFTANLGDSGTALASYKEALRTALDAHARMPGEESTKAVIEAYQQLGRIEAFLGNPRDAKEYYQGSISFADDFWREKPQDPNRKRLLAANYVLLGDLQQNDLEPDKALKSFHAALSILGSDRNGEADHDSALRGVYFRLTRARGELGSQAEALTNLRKAIAISESLDQHHGSQQQVNRDLFVAYVTIVQVSAGRETLNTGDTKTAQLYAHKALAIAEARAAGDSKNAQALYDLAFAYEAMGDSFASTEPSIASKWYRKSIILTQRMAPRYEARYWALGRDEALAATLVKKEQAPERLRLLLEANTTRQELAKTNPGGPLDRLHLMRSYCRIADAELAVHNLAKARQSADSCLAFFKEFTPASPDMLVLRDIGFCYESLGNVQHEIAMYRGSSLPARRAAEVASIQWYKKSADVWNEWSGRGAATPGSELQRRKLEHLLGY